MVVRPHTLPYRALQERHHLVELLPLQQAHRFHQLWHLLVAGVLQQQRPPSPRQADHLLGAEQPIDLPAEVPQRAQFRQVAEHLAQVLPILLGQVLRALDDQEAVLVHEAGLLLERRAAPPRPPLLLLTLAATAALRSEEHTSELQSQFHLVCRLLLEKKKQNPSASCSVPARSPPALCPSSVVTPSMSLL